MVPTSIYIYIYIYIAQGAHLYDKVSIVLRKQCKSQDFTDCYQALISLLTTVDELRRNIGAILEWLALPDHCSNSNKQVQMIFFTQGLWGSTQSPQGIYIYIYIERERENKRQNPDPTPPHPVRTRKGRGEQITKTAQNLKRDIVC